MSKERYILSGIVVVGLLISLSAALYITQRPKETTPSSASERSLTDTFGEVAQTNGNKTYTDEAGFSFTYPNDVVVADVTPLDSEFYSLLNLKTKGQLLSIAIQDTKVASLNEWQKGEGSKMALVGAITLDGIPARQYKSAMSFLTVAWDQNILYVIESPDADMWDDIHQQIIESFRFGATAEKQAATSKSSTPSESAVVYEAEEVVE